MNIKTIHIHFSFCLYLLITLYGGLLKESFFFLTCLIIHEIGHLIMIRLTRNKIKRINLTGLGFFIDLKTNPIKFKHKVLIYSGGLIASAIFQLFLSLKGSHQIFVFNTFILLVNLFPIAPLDGYNLLYTLLTLLYEDEYLNDVFLLIGTLIICLLIIFFIFFQYSFILVLIVFLSYKNYKRYVENKQFTNAYKILKFKSKY